jgi:ABC-type uncharacterized transport system auxiliary subunit
MPEEYPNNPTPEPAARLRFCAFFVLALGAAALCGCGSDPVWKSQSFAFALPAETPAAGTRTNVVALRRVTVSPLFQSRSLTYRTAENTYEHDPYAGFFISPGRAIEQPICAWLRAGGAFGSVIEPGSGLNAPLVAEISVDELYGDFRKKAQPAGVLEIHFVLYEASRDGTGRVLMDKACVRRTPMAKASPAALAAAWDEALRAIMADINTELKRLPLN